MSKKMKKKLFKINFYDPCICVSQIETKSLKNRSKFLDLYATM